jgi:hypothetical protein
VEGEIARREPQEVRRAQEYLCAEIRKWATDPELMLPVRRPLRAFWRPVLTEIYIYMYVTSVLVKKY